MKKKEFLFLSLIMVNTLTSLAQTITPSVINSAGNERTNAIGVSLIDNVGEVFVQTVTDGTVQITQGFIQTYSISSGFSLSILKNDVTCTGRNDGDISTALTSPYSTFSVSYFWSDTSVCHTNNCPNVDSLKAGTYSVMVVIKRPDPNTTTLTINDTVRSAPIVIQDVNGPCRITIYTGVTANGDKVNDVFYIKNIEEFPLNRVTIYSRWGNLLYDSYNYDNVNIYWPSQENLSTLASGTYFYVVDLGDGSKTYRGWVQLFKN